MPAVLVLDADQPSALAIVRSLGRAGLEVHVASADADPLCGYSRHAAARWRYPDPLTDEPGFVEWLAGRASVRPYALIAPVTERTVVPLMRHRDRFDPSALAVAPTQALEQALDKDRTIALAVSLGLKVPRTALVRHPDELATAAKGFDYPIVVKPARSFGADATRRVQLAVSYAGDAGELTRQTDAALRFGPVLLQEYFRGQGVGVELIADHGQIRYLFQHRRLHEVPLSGGGSSLRVAESPVPVLREASASLIKALGWHGVAMVEFKYAPETGDYRLIEINGRFWGSLPLAVAAGADFPAMLYELMTVGRISPRPPARAGTVCRQLARDVDWLEHVLRRAAPAGLVSLPSHRRVILDSLLVFSPRHHFDVQSWRDPLPGLVDVGRLIQRQWSRVGGKWTARRRLLRERRIARNAGLRRIADARRVLFLCYGNINRSALAHVCAESRYGERCTYTSAGFHAVQGRPADPTMVDLASSQGLSLQDWTSRTLTPQMVAEADIILVMEVAHLDRLRSEHPSAVDKSYLLGALSNQPGSIEVPDPFGQPRCVYERVHHQISEAIEFWLGRTARQA